MATSDAAAAKEHARSSQRRRGVEEHNITVTIEPVHQKEQPPPPENDQQDLRGDHEVGDKSKKSDMKILMSEKKILESGTLKANSIAKHAEHRAEKQRAMADKMAMKALN